MAKPGKNREEKLAYLDAALKYVTGFRRAIDAGAHVGYWSKAMAEKFENVQAAEPWPDNQVKWLKNLEGYKNAKLFCGALGDKRQMVRMDGEGHSKHYAVPDESAAVEMRMIDEWGFDDVDFIKVDCEGADTLVLMGARETILRCAPVIIVEHHTPFLERYGLEEGAPLRFLESLGMTEVERHRCDHIFMFE